MDSRSSSNLLLLKTLGATTALTGGSLLPKFLCACPTQIFLSEYFLCSAILSLTMMRVTRVKRASTERMHLVTKESSWSSSVLLLKLFTRSVISMVTDREGLPENTVYHIWSTLTGKFHVYDWSL